MFIVLTNLVHSMVRLLILYSTLSILLKMHFIKYIVSHARLFENCITLYQSVSQIGHMYAHAMMQQNVTDRLLLTAHAGGMVK